MYTSVHEISKMSAFKLDNRMSNLTQEIGSTL